MPLVMGLLVVGVLCQTPVGVAQAPAKNKAPYVLPELPRINVASEDKANIEDVVKVIDDHLIQGWKDNEVVPSAMCDDYTFIRRASLDIIGRIATPEEVAQFLRDNPATRRSQLIERLLASEEYALHWANLWSTWLLSRSGVFGRGMYQKQTADWLKEEFSVNTKYDQLVKKLLTASGKNTENGAVNFILAHVGEPTPQGKRNEEGAFEMVPITSRITRLFTGIQVQCAQCHDHPFDDSIKQKHFWGVNAFLRQVDRVGQLPRRQQDALQPLELKDVAGWNDNAIVFYEKRNGVVLRTRAEFLPKSVDEERGERLDSSRQGVDRRAALADYILDHPSFPKAITNRMWGVFFGKGFVNPIDDFNLNNPPSHPELLEELSSRFKNYGYDLKQMIRWITHSKAYHLSSVANPTNDKSEQAVLFSRMLLKAMTPEQLFESLTVATQPGSRAGTAERRERREQFLNLLVSNFGDDEGNEVNFNGTVVQALLLMNGQDINQAVTEKDKGTVAEALKKRAPQLIIKDLYMATLNREPSPREMQLIGQKVLMRVRDRDQSAPYQDLFWALLNCNEFMLNH